MAISFDAASNSGYQSSVSSLSWSHTCTSASKLQVGIGVLTNGATPTAVTYNGVTMANVINNGDGTRNGYIYELDNPDSGANTVSVTLSGSCDAAGGAVSYLNANGKDDAQSATGLTALNINVTVTTTVDNCWVTDLVATSDTAITVGAGQTQRMNVTGANGSVAMSTFGPKTPAGARTMQWDNAAGFYVICAYDVTPSTADLFPFPEAVGPEIEVKARRAVVAY